MLQEAVVFAPVLFDDVDNITIAVVHADQRHVNNEPVNKRVAIWPRNYRV